MPGKIIFILFMMLMFCFSVGVHAQDPNRTMIKLDGKDALIAFYDAVDVIVYDINIGGDNAFHSFVTPSIRANIREWVNDVFKTEVKRTYGLTVIDSADDEKLNRLYQSLPQDQWQRHLHINVIIRAKDGRSMELPVEGFVGSISLFMSRPRIEFYNSRPDRSYPEPFLFTADERSLEKAVKQSLGTLLHEPIAGIICESGRLPTSPQTKALPECSYLCEESTVAGTFVSYQSVLCNERKRLIEKMNHTKVNE